MTTAEAHRRQGLYRVLLVRTVLAAMETWAARKWRPNVIGRQMVRLGQGVPANPPPGPLGIRSGDLARTVRHEKAVFARNRFRIPLKAGGGKVNYARIHEKGGMSGRGYIPKRPYMEPGFKATRKDLNTGVQRDVDALTKKVFG